VPDVMRGEEVQVFGAIDLLDARDGLFVLPGTHSKWVQVRTAACSPSPPSCPASAMPAAPALDPRAHDAARKTARWTKKPSSAACARRRRAGSLLRSAFSVRTLALFEPPGRRARPASYLSGW
jgi:2-dehydro-3-deoxygalactonokinase